MSSVFHLRDLHATLSGTYVELSHEGLRQQLLCAYMGMQLMRFIYITAEI
jgi:hypothetical protein